MKEAERGRSLPEHAAELLAEPGRDLDQIARTLRQAHGDRAYTVLWQVLVDRTLPLPRARDEWEEALRLQERLQSKSGMEIPLLVALLQRAVQEEPDLEVSRVLRMSSYSRLVESSTTDGLTGLYNYRYFQDALYRELKRSKRYRHSLSLLMLDLDDFKSYNDANGHIAGDKALVETARLLLRNCREIDTVCRYGGEEFVVILPSTDKEGARILGEKLRRRIEEHPFPGEKSCPQGELTVSGGIATFPDDGVTIEELLGNADKALYQAKNFIKNAVCYYYREDRRAWPRIEKEYRLRHRTSEGEEWTESMTRDISRGGLSFDIEGPAPELGEEIELEILAGGPPVLLTGTVVRIERFEEGGLLNLGVAFDPNPEEVKALLRRL